MFEEILGPELAAIFATFLLAFIVIGIVTYIYTSIAIMMLANRLKTENAWLAWIPIANVYLVTQIAKQEWWWTLVIIFAGIIPVLGNLISIGALIYMFTFIAKRRNYPDYSALLLLLPIVNLVYLGFLAWGK